MQRLIYQLVPNLLDNELDRRDKFPLKDTIKSEIILTANCLVQLKLVNGQTRKNALANISNLNENKSVESNKQIDNNNANLNTTTENVNANDKTSLSPRQDQEPSTTKYIQCIAQTPISIIIRMLRNKYNIPLNYAVNFTLIKKKIYFEYLNYFF